MLVIKREKHGPDDSVGKKILAKSTILTGTPAAINVLKKPDLTMYYLMK